MEIHAYRGGVPKRFGDKIAVFIGTSDLEVGGPIKSWGEIPKIRIGRRRVGIGHHLRILLIYKKHPKKVGLVC